MSSLFIHGRDVAVILGVCTRTVERWVSAGVLPSINTARPGVRPRRRIPKDGLASFLSTLASGNHPCRIPPHALSEIARHVRDHTSSPAASSSPSISPSSTASSTPPPSFGPNSSPVRAKKLVRSSP